MNTTTGTIRGVGFLVLSLLTFSLQDVAARWMGGDYLVSKIVLFRSIVVLPATLLFVCAEGQRGLPISQRRRLEHARLCLFLSSTPYKTGLALLVSPITSSRWSDARKVSISSPIAVLKT